MLPKDEILKRVNSPEFAQYKEMLRVSDSFSQRGYAAGREAMAHNFHRKMMNVSAMLYLQAAAWYENAVHYAMSVHLFDEHFRK